MKKEDIRIRVTPENVKEFIEVLRRNGENVTSVMDTSFWWCAGFMFIRMNVDEDMWYMYATSLGNKQVTDSPSFNWTPQDLDKYLSKEKYDRLYEAKRILKEQNDFDRKIHTIHVHERPYVPDEHIKHPIFTGKSYDCQRHIVKNADGTASSVTLRDDKAVVEMPNGTLRIVDKSNLLTLRHEKDDLREEDR